MAHPQRERRGSSRPQIDLGQILQMFMQMMPTGAQAANINQQQQELAVNSGLKREELAAQTGSHTADRSVRLQEIATQLGMRKEELAAQLGIHKEELGIKQQEVGQRDKALTAEQQWRAEDRKAQTDSQTAQRAINEAMLKLQEGQQKFQQEMMDRQQKFTENQSAADKSFKESTLATQANATAAERATAVAAEQERNKLELHKQYMLTDPELAKQILLKGPEVAIKDDMAAKQQAAAMKVELAKQDALRFKAQGKTALAVKSLQGIIPENQITELLGGPQAAPVGAPPVPNVSAPGSTSPPGSFASSMDKLLSGFGNIITGGQLLPLAPGPLPGDLRRQSKQ